MSRHSPHLTKLKATLSWAPEDGQKFAPKHVELILEINKTVIVASRWFSILLYLH